MESFRGQCDNNHIEGPALEASRRWWWSSRRSSIAVTVRGDVLEMVDTYKSFEVQPWQQAGFVWKHRALQMIAVVCFEGWRYLIMWHCEVWWLLARKSLLNALRLMAGWVWRWTCFWAASARHREDEVVRDGSQLPSHPLLCHCLHMVQFHSHHNAGYLHQLAQFVGATCPTATSPAHHSEEDNTGHHTLAEHL